MTLAPDDPASEQFEIPTTPNSDDQTPTSPGVNFINTSYL
jgi:hypothetical protein